MAIRDGDDLRAVIQGNFNTNPSSANEVRLGNSLTRAVRTWRKTADDALAADTTPETIVFSCEQNLRVIAARFTPDGALTADDTNFATFTLARRRAGASTTFQTRTTQTTAGGGSGNWSAWVPVDFPADPENFQASDVITVAIGKSGAGVIVQAGLLELWVETL